MHVYLIGYRGSGKSTVGRLVAQRLGRSAIDTDDMIEHESGLSIRQIFELEGEAGFRDRETRALQSLVNKAEHPAIVSLGGGAVLRKENQRIVLESGDCVWLTASAEHLFQRIQSDKSTQSRRPNLSQAGGYDEVADILRIRTPIYQKLANFTVVVEGKTPDEIADEVVGWVDSRSLNHQ